MIGEMTEQIRFLRRGRIQRDDGGYTADDSSLGDVFAQVRPVEAREPEQAGRLYGSTSFIVLIHADDKPETLTTGDFVGWLTAPGDPVAFNIRGIRQARGRALYLEIVCEAGAVDTDIEIVPFVPSLDFSELRNSQYSGQVV